VSDITLRATGDDLAAKRFLNYGSASLAMLGKKAVPALLIACNIVAGLCLLSHTRSVLNFIMLLSVMMVSAVAATAWYTYVDDITQPYKGVPQTMLLEAVVANKGSQDSKSPRRFLSFWHAQPPVRTLHSDARRQDSVRPGLDS
jgi:hypothetical protein